MKVIKFIFITALIILIWKPWPRDDFSDFWMGVRTYAVFGVIFPGYLFLVLLANYLVNNNIKDIVKRLKDED